MSENQVQKADTRSASQKIQDIENAMFSLYQTADNMARDLNLIKEALKLLNNKVSSIIKASSDGVTSFNNEVIDKIMTQNNIEELANKVKLMVVQGVLAPSEQVTPQSFIVGSEQNDLGETVNPRFQFALYAIQVPETKEKFIGARVGDVLNLQEGSTKFKISEIYEIQPPKQEQAEQAEPAPAPNSAPAEASSPEAQPTQSATPTDQAAV